ncbi:MAG: PadR family transcriptional regulator [Proteobacteria bacterium]|nr:PadR family transcriptional regulator [Pseudomonadota bacterium]
MQDNPQPTDAGLKLNPLAYQILGLIARDPTTGYDIVKALHRFRPVKLSQVYQALSIMEAAGLVEVNEVTQQGKPNKRLHRILPRGAVILNGWIERPTHHPAKNDEFVRKVYSLWHAPAGQRRALMAERMDWLKGEIAYFEAMRDALADAAPDRLADPDCWEFSRRILVMRRLALCREEMRWCETVLGLLADPPDEP